MTVQHKSERPKATEIVVPIIIGILGVAAIAVTRQFLIPDLRTFDMLMLLIVVAFAALGYRRSIIRAILTAVILYFATGVAATFYVPAAPYVGAPFADTEVEVSRGIKGLSFIVLTLIVWIVLEIIAQRFLEDVSISWLGFLDNLIAVFLHLAIGVFVATLLFNAAGYADQWRRAHNRAYLRPQFKQVLSWHYTAQSFWFRKPPAVYVYDLDLSSEP